MSQQRAALSVRTARVWSSVARERSSGAGSFKCWAESLSQFAADVVDMEKIPAIVRALSGRPGSPRARIETLDPDWVHAVVTGMALQEGLTYIDRNCSLTRDTSIFL